MLKNIRLKDDEEILLEARSGFGRYFWAILSATVLFIAPFFFMLPLFSFKKWGMIVFVLSLFLAIVIFIRQVIIWRQNIIVITTHRIFDFSQKGLWRQQFFEFPLMRISGIRVEKKGMSAVLFDYGHLYIKLNSLKTIFILKYVKQPIELEQFIYSIKDTYWGVGQSLGDLTEEKLIKILIKIRKKIGEERFTHLIKKSQPEN